MSFDGRAFGEEMVAVVRGFVERENAALRAEFERENAALRSANAALSARLAEVESREMPAPVDLAPIQDALLRVAGMVEALPPAPDLSGFATAADVAEVRAAIPVMPDVAGLRAEIEAAIEKMAEDVDRASDFWINDGATKAELAAVRASIPVLPPAPDLSAFATKEDVEAVRGAIFSQ